MASGQVRFDGRAILVTGAGRGIGRAQALLLASRGAKVVVADNGSAMDGEEAGTGPAESVVDEIAAAGGEAVACTADLSHRDGAEQAIAASLEAFGRIDGIVHYASSCPELKGPVELVDRDIDLVLAINPFAAMWLARAAWPRMVSQGFGRILLTPSAALYGALGNTPYAAAKGALVGVIRCLALEGAGHGICVNGVMPSALSRMTETFLPEDYLQWFAQKMPPEKVAAAAAWLLSEDCTINGEIFAMGGGRIARVVLAEAEGVCGTAETIEQARDAMASVMADESFFFPRDLDERTAKVMPLLGD